MKRSQQSLRAVFTRFYATTCESCNHTDTSVHRAWKSPRTRASAFHIVGEHCCNLGTAAHATHALAIELLAIHPAQNTHCHAP
eukprot:767074-Amphidinium_carterae.2